MFFFSSWTCQFESDLKGAKLQPTYLPAGSFWIVTDVYEDSKTALCYAPKKGKMFTKPLEDLIVVTDATSLVEIPRMILDDRPKREKERSLKRRVNITLL